MRIVGTAWYLFGLLIAAALLELAITYAPSAEHLSNVMLGVTLAFAGVSGVAAAWLTIKRKRDPGSRMFQSKAASTVALCVAACVTLVVLFGVVG